MLLPLLLFLPAILQSQSTTPEYCPNNYLNQDIAIVWEESSSTGSFKVSGSVNNFIHILLPKLASNLADANDQTWSSITNLSLVAYPNPYFYGNNGQFGTVTRTTYSGILEFIKIIGEGNSENSRSDINSGLLAAQTEFGNLSSGREQTIILFTNVATGIPDAMNTANQLKTNGNTMLTVSAVTGPTSTIDMHDLSSGAQFEFTLDTSNETGFGLFAAQIVETIVTVSTQCCLSADCTTTTSQANVV